MRRHLNIAIPRLGCRAFHNNVNGRSPKGLADKKSVGITTQEMRNFLLGSTIRNLKGISEGG